MANNVASASVQLEYVKDPVKIAVTPQTVLLKKGQPKSVKVYVDVYVGGALKTADSCSTLTNSTSTPIATGLSWNFGTEEGRFYYRLKYYTAAGDLDLEIPFTVSYDGNTYQERLFVKTFADGDKGDDGLTGASMMPPMFWEDYADAYPFKCGDVANGEIIRHAVLMKNSSTGAITVFFCVQSHAKASDKAPGNTAYWSTGAQWDYLYTKALVAESAYIQALTVGGIEMRDPLDDSKVLFSAKDGNVVCKTGTFENVVLSGFLKPVKTVVDSLNYQHYLLNMNADLPDAEPDYVIDAAKFTGLVVLHPSLNSLISSNVFAPIFYLPSKAAGSSGFGMKDGADINDYIGSRIRIVNNTDSDFSSSGRIISLENTGEINPSFQSYRLRAGYELVATCSAYMGAVNATSENKIIAWKIEYLGPTDYTD